MTNLANHPDDIKRNQQADSQKAASRFAYKASKVYSSDEINEGRNYIRRVLREELTPTEYCIVDYIADRTIEFGKTWETITYAQMVSGTKQDENGKRFFCKIGLSERSIRDGLARLEARGLIALRDLDERSGKRQFALRIPCLMTVHPVHAPRQSLPGGTGKLCPPEVSKDEVTKTSLRSEPCGHTSGEDSLIDEGQAEPIPTEPAQPKARTRTRPRREAHLDVAKRAKRDIPTGEEYRELIEIGADIADERSEAAGRPTGPCLPRPSPVASPTLARAASGPPIARQRKRTGVPQLERAWSKSVLEATGVPANGWTPQQRKNMAETIECITLPDPSSMTWEAVLGWLAKSWGEANALARPAAFKFPDNVDRIIKAQPRIYHFLHYAEEYAQAYLTLFHGEGVDAKQEQLMDRLQKAFDRHHVRSRLTYQQGSANLPSDVLSDSELVGITEQSGKDGDTKALAALKRREGYRKARAEYYGRRQVNETQAKKFDKAVRVHRVREERERIEADPEIQAMFPTVDRSEMCPDW